MNDRSHSPLYQAWHRVKRYRPDISQKELALEWGLTEGAISQYIRGHTELNVEAQLWFARYLEVPVTDIWPDFAFRDLCPGSLPPKAIAVARDWTKLSETQSAQAAAFADLIHAAANP